MSGTDNLPTGGQAMVEVLKAQGVRTVFCLAGAAHAPFLRDLEVARFHIISSRSENATVAAADGYARACGKVGIAMIAGHQGMPNALGGIRTAQLACSPVVLLASVGEGNSEAMGEETNDGLDMVKPFVKWAKTVPDAERLEEFFNAAIHAARSGRPGVAVLGIPTHLEGVRLKKPRSFSSAKTLAAAPEPASEAIEEAVALLKGAQQPLILCGSGAALSGAGPALQALSKDLGAPVFGHALGRGLVPEDMIHGFPWALAQVAAKNADVVLVAGIRLQQRIGFGMAPRFKPDAKFIQVDIEAVEPGRNRTIDVPIQADARKTVERLHAGLKAAGAATASTAWVNDAIAARLARLDELGQDEAGPIHPVRIGRELMKIMPAESIFVADGADVYNWMSGVVRMRSPRGYMDHYPLGSMGIGTPLALGAAAAERETSEDTGVPARPVVLVTGDGAFGFYPSEFNSMQLAGLKVICIISNDGNWGTERNALKTKLGTTVNTVIGQCDYHLIGPAFGVLGERVAAAADLPAALERAFAAETSTIINVITDPDAGEARKQDPRLMMVTFEDLKSSLDAHHVMDLA
jgi:acetolactate synthase-1/2/3 large subunit